MATVRERETATRGACVSEKWSACRESCQTEKALYVTTLYRLAHNATLAGACSLFGPGCRFQGAHSTCSQSHTG
eukprot:1171564-Prorocentrum_minimum.AAC.1